MTPSGQDLQRTRHQKSQRSRFRRRERRRPAPRPRISKVVVVIDEAVPEVRRVYVHGRHHNGNTHQRHSRSIPAFAMRELVYDASGHIVKPPVDNSRRSATRRPPPRSSSRADAQGNRGACSPNATATGSSRSRSGIAGDKYFEVIDGLKPNDQVITGPMIQFVR